MHGTAIGEGSGRRLPQKGIVEAPFRPMGPSQTSLLRVCTVAPAFAKRAHAAGLRCARSCPTQQGGKYRALAPQARRVKLQGMPVRRAQAVADPRGALCSPTHGGTPAGGTCAGARLPRSVRLPRSPGGDPRHVAVTPHTCPVTHLVLYLDEMLENLYCLSQGELEWSIARRNPS